MSIYPENRIELYDIESDRGETTDIAALHPDVVTNMLEQWNLWAVKNDVKNFNQFSELTKSNRKAILSRK